MSAVLPGSAQLVAGNRAIGRIVLRTWLALLGIALLIGIVAWFSVGAVVGLLSAQWFLRIATIVLFAWAAVWALVLLDAWRLSNPPAQAPRIRRRLAIATALLLVLPGSVAYAGASVSAGRSALAQVFGDGPAFGADAGRYNILLLGSDSGAGREGVRPDSLQLLSVNEETGRAVTFGFTRDTEHIVFERGSVMAGLMPDGWTCGNECLLNGLYTWAWDHADQFPDGVDDPGLLSTREAVEALSGLDIQYYALIDLGGFRSLIDAFGGLEIEVMRRTPIGGGTSPVSGYIEPGVQHLDGYHALWYARSRHGSSNYERMARQRCVMSAMASQIDPQTVALQFRNIAAASTGVLKTDIPQSELGRFAELALKTRTQPIQGVNFVPPLIKPWDYDPKEVRAIVADTIKESDDAAAAELAAAAAAEEAAEAGADPASPASPTAPVTESPTEPSASESAPPVPGDPATEAYDPMANPSEDAHAQADDIASVCSVG